MDVDFDWVKLTFVLFLQGGGKMPDRGGKMPEQLPKSSMIDFRWTGLIFVLFLGRNGKMPVEVGKSNCSGNCTRFMLVTRGRVSSSRILSSIVESLIKNLKTIFSLRHVVIFPKTF